MEVIKPTNRFIGIFPLSMLFVSAIVSLRNLPTTALLGTKAISYFILAGGAFFVPIALVCAELAAAWPEKGGVYIWIKEAFGPKTGFMAIWLEWIEGVVWLPTILSFMAATTSYLINPSLEQNKVFLITCMLLYLWGGTFINFRGLKLSSAISSLGVILGTLIPGLILIALGFWQFFSDSSHAVPLDFGWQAILPDGNLNTLVTMTAILLGFCGIEIPAYYVQHVKNPAREYPQAIFLATLIILGIYSLGSLAVSMVVPADQISLIAGPMQTFQYFFAQFHLNWVGPLLAGITLVGGIAILNIWIIGPSKGLLASAEAGHLPALFTRTNKHQIPVPLLYLQGIIGTALIWCFVLNPSIKSVYWLINILAAQLYLVMYLMVFLACIRLRYSQPQKKRTYQIPGGKLGVWCVSGLGALACLAAMGVGFIKPDTFDMNLSQLEYATYLGAGMVTFSLPPFFFMWWQRRKA